MASANIGTIRDAGDRAGNARTARRAVPACARVASRSSPLPQAGKVAPPEEQQAGMTETSKPFRRIAPSCAAARRVALAPLALLAAGNSAPVELEVTFDDVRDAKGLLQLCLTREARHFPDCSDDPAAIKRSVAAATRSLRLTLPQAGPYALSVLHDANGNGRADTVLGIPREGFGFSRNPPIRFGPPRFSATVMELDAGLTRQTVHMRYLL